nr:hypothetical protein BaRGS_011797 [Batillaria attramentaria]KAG5707092.1 hypothetical protein BaRGS_011803 [Batillaria attramentaria]
MATYPGERVQIISVSGLKTKDLTTWLHQQDEATDIESVTFHIGVNDCKSGEVTSLSWDEIIGSCRRVFPNARLHASSIIPAKGRQNINRPIASSNANLHHVCQKRGVVFIDNRSTFVAESGAPRKALYRQDSGDFIHLSIRVSGRLQRGLDEVSNWCERNLMITAHTYTADRATKAPPEVSEDG